MMGHIKVIMKAFALLASILILSCTADSRADDCCEGKSVTVQQIHERLRQIDLDIVLKQYEQLQSEKAKTEIQLILLETQAGNDDDRKAQLDLLRNRIELFKMHADEMRQRAVSLGASPSVATK